MKATRPGRRPANPWLVAFALLAAVAEALAQPSVPLVAEIDATVVRLGKSKTGPCAMTGIVVGASQGQVFIASPGPTLDEWDLQREPVYVAGDSDQQPWIQAKVVRVDPSAGVELAVLSVRKEDWAAGDVGARQLTSAPGASLRRGDGVSAMGCMADRLSISSARKLLRDQSRGGLLVDTGDLPVEMAGAAVVHSVGGEAVLLGTLKFPEARSEVRSISALLAVLRDWQVPVTIETVGGAAGCSYSVSRANPGAPPSGTPSIMLSSGGDRQVLRVDTAPKCAWRVVYQPEPWLSIAPGSGSGGGFVTVSAIQANQCEGRMRSTVAYIGGQFLRIEQDGANAGIGCR